MRTFTVDTLMIRVVVLVARLPSVWDGIGSASLRLVDFFSRSR